MKAAQIVAAVVLAATAISGYPYLQAQSALPRDVHPDTRNRLPPLKRGSTKEVRHCAKAPIIKQLWLFSRL